MIYEDIKASKYHVDEGIQHALNMMSYDQISGFTVLKGDNSDYVIKLIEKEVKRSTK